MPRLPRTNRRAKHLTLASLIIATSLLVPFLSVGAQV